MKKRALFSVTDKTGVVQFAQGLHEAGWEIVSTGGTAKAITDGGVPCTLVEEVTGFPEMLNGRLKTLHPKIFGGILADQQNSDHMRVIELAGIEAFGMVVVNLYDFAGSPSIEQIDIGGPSLIRAAAKNHESVIVVVKPENYASILEEIKSEQMDWSRRQELAAIAFTETAKYELQIASHFNHCHAAGQPVAKGSHH